MRIQNDIRVTLLVDKGLKEQAESLFDRLGMNLSTAFTVFLRKSLEMAAIPFPVSSRPTGFGTGYIPSDITGAFVSSVEDEIERDRKHGFSIAKYDPEQKAAYLEAPDGSREYVNV